MPQIIASVLKDQGMQADTWRFQLSAEYRPRLYCVQYETALHFVQRLCEEEGLHFHFQHSANGHVLVFGDDQTSFFETRPVNRVQARQRYGRRSAGD
ncbi:contractile injection system protein, VgrG/Pvc8 family [Pseudomonas lini]